VNPVNEFGKALGLIIILIVATLIGMAVLIGAPIASEWVFMQAIHWPQVDLAYKCRDAGGTNLDGNASCWKTYSKCIEEPCTPYTEMVEVKRRLKLGEWME